MSEYLAQHAKDVSWGYRGIRLLGYAISAAALAAVLGLPVATAISAP